MKKIVKDGTKNNKNYFPDGKKVRFVCDSCGCEFNVIAPDDDVKYDTLLVKPIGLFVDTSFITITFRTHCPQCNADCIAIEKEQLNE